jgi:hypothetical protein
MKSRILFIILSLFGLTVLSQDQVNVIGTLGKIGVSTSTPENEFEVVGQTKLDGDAVITSDLSLDGDLGLSSLANPSCTQGQFLSVCVTGKVLPIDFLNLDEFINGVRFPRLIDSDQQFVFVSSPRKSEVSQYSSDRAIYTGDVCGSFVEKNKGFTRYDLDVDSGERIFEDVLVGGRMGIGTTLQEGYALAVCGMVGAREVKVQANAGWCDYVFEESYELKDLSELETYIAENKHLPDVPSATEINTNGIEVSEMMAIMIKKIEELTLYTIQQEKELSQMRKEILELKAASKDSKFSNLSDKE